MCERLKAHVTPPQRTPRLYTVASPLSRRQVVATCRPAAAAAGAWRLRRPSWAPVLADRTLTSCSPLSTFTVQACGAALQATPAAPCCQQGWSLRCQLACCKWVPDVVGRRRRRATPSPTEDYRGVDPGSFALLEQVIRCLLYHSSLRHRRTQRTSSGGAAHLIELSGSATGVICIPSMLGSWQPAEGGDEEARSADVWIGMYGRVCGRDVGL